MSFVHLHNHSDYSLLDGACRIPGLIESAIEMNAPAVALTDHGNLFGALEFYSKAREKGIKPIIGCELYLAPDTRLNKKPGTGELRYHQVLLAKNLQGYYNLVKLASEAYVSGFYYKPRIDKELLVKYSEGLICLSSCLAGEIPQKISNLELDAAKEAVMFYKQVFGDDFYLELQRHGIDLQEKIIPYLAELAEDHDIKLVVTNDAHYLKKEHAQAHDVLLCVGTQAQRNDANRMRFDTEEFYIKSEEEMRALFQDFPQAVDNTCEIADKVNIEIPLGQNHFPVFQLPPEPELTPEIYLDRLAREGLNRRFNNDPSPEAVARLEMELKVIADTGFSNYFLIVSDFVQWAKNHNVPVGPGRGSAAGCLVSYSLGITNLNPLKYELIFERFLNPERVTPPDIDIDFADDRREEVIKYVREKYGQDSVCRITTFGKMAARSAVRDVARALGLPFSDGDRIARLIPMSIKDIPLEKTISEVSELKQLLDSELQLKEVVDYASIIQGSARHAGTHAAGVVICPGPTVDFIPVYKQGDDDELYTQYDMNWIDKFGLLKMDFLGLQTLTELDLTLKSLESKGIHVELDDIPLDDPAVLDLFAKGKTNAVFQFESSGMRDNLMKLKPERLDDLIAMNALYRPGPMQNIDLFIQRRHGAKTEYLHPKLKPILDSTYGIVVYQEQVMRIATDLAGFSLGKADNLRWAMGKKKMDLMQSLKAEFIHGCIDNNIAENTAVELFAFCEQFAKYGFPKAHSAGYALIAYQCAYLKTHYPADYLASCLTVRRSKPDQMLTLLSECRTYKIQILPPDVNQSIEGFVATEDGIRFGLGAIKNIGDAAVSAIISARNNVGEFTTLHHFLTSVDMRVINKKIVESLIDSGALDSLGPNRNSLMASLPSAMAYAQGYHEEQSSGQETLFGGENVNSSILPLPEVKTIPEKTLQELQGKEKELLGYYITSHPLEKYRQEMEGLASHELVTKEHFEDSLQVKLCGVITNVRRRKTKKGNMMLIVKFEDLTGTIECLVMPQNLEKLENEIFEDRLVGIAGRISKKEEEEEPKLMIDEVLPLDKIADKWSKSVRIRVEHNELTEPLVVRLEQLLSDNPGNCPLYIELSYPGGKLKRLKVGKYSIRPEQSFIARLSDLVGENRVSLQ